VRAVAGFEERGRSAFLRNITRENDPDPFVSLSRAETLCSRFRSFTCSDGSCRLDRRAFQSFIEEAELRQLRTQFVA